MKISYFYLILFILSIPKLNAQQIYICDFEDCATQGYSDCFVNPYGWDGPICTTNVNHTPDGSYSGLIPDDGTTDAILDLGNQIFGIYGIEFWMYVPTNKEAYWNLQGVVPIGSGEWIVGNIYFNKDIADSGRGFIDWGTANTNDDTYFDFPHDQWFQIIINVDISTGIAAANWQFGVDGIEIVPLSPFENGNGENPTSLGGIDFFSISSDNLYYLDDINFKNSFFAIDIIDFKAKVFSFSPNPFKDKLHIKADETITNVFIYTLLGQKVYSKNIDKKEFSIDTSNLTNGTYILKVTIGNTIGNMKIVK